MKKSKSKGPLHVKEHNRDSCACSQSYRACGESHKVCKQTCEVKEALEEILTSKKTAYPEKVTV